jgi:hypothetical protein
VICHFERRKCIKMYKENIGKCLVSDVLHSSDTGEKMEHGVTLYQRSRMSVWYRILFELGIITGFK